jgi:hypothetical protein
MHVNNATVRVTHDGLLFAVDLLMAVTGKTRNNAAHAIRCNKAFDSRNFQERRISER